MRFGRQNARRQDCGKAGKPVGVICDDPVSIRRKARISHGPKKHGAHVGHPFAEAKPTPMRRTGNTAVTFPEKKKASPPVHTERAQS
jgi:hypothetical protein